jgi:hypothetical protein
MMSSNPVRITGLDATELSTFWATATDHGGHRQDGLSGCYSFTVERR